MNRPTLATIQRQLEQYVTFQTPAESLAVALWVIGTYLWQGYDSFPYLLITSDTKRSGKTRLSEVAHDMSHKPRQIAGVTGPTLLRHMAAGETLFIDEAEALGSEAKSIIRTVLNIGYRRGQMFTRVNDANENGLEEWPVYGPKAFILIGDVYDTLRDRSIIIRLRRRAPSEESRRFLRAECEVEGADIRAMIEADRDSGAFTATMNAYRAGIDLLFLSDRDAEVWAPLFAICMVFAPERVEELKSVAVDIATEKTAPLRTIKGLQDAEDDATADEYRRRLLADMCGVIPRDGYMHTESLLTALKAIPTAPWRRFRGVGLTSNDIGNMLDVFGVHPRPIRSKGGRKGSRVARGYQGKEVHAAAETNHINLNVSSAQA